MRATMTFADRCRYAAAQTVPVARKPDTPPTRTYATLSPRQLQATLERLFAEQERLRAARELLKREAAPSPERSEELARIRKRLSVVSGHISQTRLRYQRAAREALDAMQQEEKA